MVVEKKRIVLIYLVTHIKLYLVYVTPKLVNKNLLKTKLNTVYWTIKKDAQNVWS